MKEKTNVNNDGWRRLQKRLFKMVSVGVIDDKINQGYDVISTGMLVLNLTAAVLNTFNSISDKYGTILASIETWTVLFFAIDYVLRLLTARYLYPDKKESVAVGKYIISFSGIIDLLSFLPFYLPIFFPAGAAVFRMFRVVRILRLFRINAYYDSLNVITEVIVRKRQQLISSVFIIVILMLASSLCMYSLENKAQPDVFSNAFSGIWWAASTLLTVGYGDIYPITPAGKMMGIIITFLGVGMVAIPTGIISAGFVEQYTRLKTLGEFGKEKDVHFIELTVSKGDNWAGKTLLELKLPKNALVAAVIRGKESLLPKANLKIQENDTLIIGAEANQNHPPIDVKEIVIDKAHPWNGEAVRNLDISRQSYIVLIKRNGNSIIPRGDIILIDGDVLFIYSNIKRDDFGV
ncbi:MAG: ion transporter [Lachnospiraceae bacterium]|nr:ion transporter [Lachnospiraceae bacterium]